jgi:hypothetical protein
MSSTTSFAGRRWSTGSFSSSLKLATGLLDSIGSSEADEIRLGLMGVPCRRS